MIAKLAESRKAQKSIYSFGPVATISVPAKPAAVPSTSSQSANPDLLGSILASQTQLLAPTAPTRSKPKHSASSNRVLGAILASQATLNRLDETIKSLGKPRESPSIKSDRSARPTAIITCGHSRPTDAADQGSTSSTNGENPSQGSSKSNSETPTSNARRTNGRSGGEASGNGLPSGNGGEDPNWNRKKKSDPEDKKDEAADEEDVDLYSDIESVEEGEEAEQPDLLPKNEVII